MHATFNERVFEYSEGSISLHRPSSSIRPRAYIQRASLASGSEFSADPLNGCHIGQTDRSIKFNERTRQEVVVSAFMLTLFLSFYSPSLILFLFLFLKLDELRSPAIQLPNSANLTHPTISIYLSISMSSITSLLLVLSTSRIRSFSREAHIWGSQ